MTPTLLSVADIAARGEAIYEARIKADETNRHGQFAVIDVESGDFEIDPDEESAAARLSARRTDQVFYVKKIGFGDYEFICGAQ